MKLPLFFAFLSLSAPAHAAVIYAADFSVSGQGATHDSIGDALESSPVAGSNWMLTFGSPSSDGTTNEFVTIGGLMRVQDWGGDGTLTSQQIHITGNGTVDITGEALTIGTDVFSVSTEGITWFYRLNDGTPVSQFIGEAELGIGPVPAGVDVGHHFTSIPVSAGDVLEVGFTVRVDGADDGVEISALEVDFTQAPEPSSASLFAVALMGLIFYRKK
ncbi:hypothetical protein HW115_05995 [Verrucomicrobiaceae bacterium N1E253]|uniref:PEP-CTERM protein-sorting domain-containing protein n=1 Tax=Oceaniferula marina TaxID=2748318 RepID=A0A851GC37_9BACT|nr:hypothetical protein [Oceaniferula marina]NWK55153.1 hypothetical protein [Oceaniferula marina]